MKQSYRKLFYMVTALFIISCKPKEEQLFIDIENKEWLSNFKADSLVSFIDNNQILHNIYYQSINNSSVGSSSKFIGIKTSQTFSEYSGQYFNGINFRGYISLSAVKKSKNLSSDILSVSLNSINFMYDLDLKKIVTVNLNTDYEYDNIMSEIVFLDTLKINNKSYNNVLNFKLKDFSNKWDSYTVTDLYIAKGSGLIKFKTQNGLEFSLR